MTSKLSEQQKRQLYRDGYVIIRNAVAPELIEAAKARIKRAQKGENLGTCEEMTDLVNASSLTPIIHDVMGQFDPVSACHVAVRKKAQPGEYFGPMGYRDKDLPYYGAELHIEGSVTMAPPQEVQQGTPDEIYARHFASGPNGDVGRSADVVGINMGSLFQDPEMTLSLGTITAFAFVSLHDQTIEGCGQTGIIPGAHHAVTDFFRWQRAQNGCIGPEGPGWPRLDHDTPNRCGMHYLPPKIREQYTDESSERSPDGKRWPKPMQVLLGPGDACVTVHAIPHAGTRNENGSESRKSIIFRLRNKKRQPNVVVTGGTDHPDRGPRSEWLEFEEGNNPWERSKDALCDPWSEWDGLQGIIAEEQAKSA